MIIASGSPYDNATRTETFNWQNEDNYTCDLPDQPNGIGGAVPVLIENIEYICGGGYPSTAHCFNLITADTAPFNLLHKRVGASSVTANDKVFVFGGWNGIERDMASYETISVDNAQSEGVLPFTWSNGCSTLINSTTILLAGGRQHMTIKSEKTWLFNFETEEWTQGPSMIEGRNAFGCGLIKSINSVAAFGGYPSIGRTEIVKTSELVKLPGGIFKKGNHQRLFDYKVLILLFLQLMICPLNFME